jgi:hypothetical protein
VSVPPEAGRSLPRTAAEELRAAFGQYATATGWLWKVSIRALDQPGSGSPGADVAVVRIELSRDDAGALAGLILDAAAPEGRGPRGPIGEWMGTADAASRLGVAASTIRGWVNRNLPKANPFPQADLLYRGRSYWQKKTIDKWRVRQRRLENQERRPRR